MYFYLTDHDTAAINFDAYSRCNSPFGGILHFCLDKPFDTGVSKAEFMTLTGAAFSWSTASQESRDKSSSSVSIDTEYGRSAWISFEGKWQEINPAEKFPMELTLGFTCSAVIRFIADLTAGQYGNEPMLRWETLSEKHNDIQSFFMPESDKQDDETSPEEEFIPPVITAAGDTLTVNPVNDLSDDELAEYADVFDIPDEGKKIGYDTYARLGKFSKDGICLTLEDGWNGQLGSEKKLKYFACCYADGILSSTPLLDRSALEPGSIENAPKGKIIEICKLYCRAENGEIKDRTEQFNDGTWSEHCGPFRLFNSLAEDGSLLATAVIVKESDFANFIELTKEQPTALGTKAIVVEVMKRYMLD